MDRKKRTMEEIFDNMRENKKEHPRKIPRKKDVFNEIGKKLFDMKNKSS